MVVSPFIAFLLSLYSQGADSHKASCFVNALTDYTIGAHGELLNIFFDSFSLPDGEQFDVTFMMGLSRSLVVTPFITSDALARMCQPNSEQRLDHVLLEWWLALTLYENEAATVKSILPVFCGEVRGWG